jgi:uncharacterized protein YggE
MSRKVSLLLGMCLVALMAFAAPGAAQTGTVTATGTGQTRVLPTNRSSNASIVAAYHAAEQASIAGAISQAHEKALAYAQAVGLSLGSVVSVSDASNNGYIGPGQFFGPFGPDQFCGTLRQPVFKMVGHRRKVVRVKKVHRCVVPRFAFTTLTLTYSAS